MSLDFNADSMPAMDTASSGMDMDFSLSEPSASADAGSNVIDFAMPSAAEPESASHGLDFSAFEQTSTNTVADTSEGNAIEFNTASLGDTAMEFESEAAESPGAGAEAGLPGWDETATKLDLAKAYIDMGDAEGARSILDEVMSEGSESQKKQARDLASQIAA